MIFFKEFFQSKTLIFSIVFKYSDTRRRYDQSIEKLRDTIHTLEELLVLKERFNLRIPFDDYYNVRI